MSKLILTSFLDFYKKDKNGQKIAQNFGNKNRILNILKRNVRKFDNFVFVGNGHDEESLSAYFEIAKKSFELTLPFENYYLLSYKTKNAKELIENADLIFLCGGHLPTQNKFFNDINLKAVINNTKALIVGGSAGSMNCADNVYCPPELEEEVDNEEFNRFYDGLGLTNINILPHYDEFKKHVLKGKRYIEDIVMPDSYKTEILALNNHSYIEIEAGKAILYGEAYTIKDGQINQICKYNNKIELK